MSQFTFPLLGRTWSLHVDLPTQEAVLSATGGAVDLFEAFDEKLYVALAKPRTLMCVLWTLIKEQAGDVTPEEFARAFRGDAIEKATEALQAAITDFFPSRQRALLMKAAAKGSAVMDRVLTVIEEKLDAPVPDLMLNENSGNSAASSAETPGSNGSPGVNSPG